MGHLGCDNDETKPYKRHFDVDIGDTQHLDFDSQYSPFSGNDEIYGLQNPEAAQPLVDAVLTNDAFETQLLNFDGETQQLDCSEETEVMDFGEETQLLNSEGDCYSIMETQLCETHEQETAGDSDEEDTVGTEVLTDMEDSTDVEVFKNCNTKTSRSEGMKLTSVCSQDEAESKSIGSVHSAVGEWSSGSLRREFTSIRTASLRASGLSARKKSLKILESRDGSNQHESKSSRLFCEAVDQESEMGNTNELAEGLIHDSNTKPCKSTSRKLFMDGIDIGEHEHKDNTNDRARGEDLDRVNNCTNDLAELTYVNSEEPGDLSQANALDFVQKFLEDYVCDFDLESRQINVACVNQKSMLSAKGTQKLAKKANMRCSLANARVYDWDNSLEDEGGGEFLTRNKELFFGNSFGVHKSLTELPKPKRLSRLESGRFQKRSMNEECQSEINKPDKVIGSGHSEPRLTAVREGDQLEKLCIRRDLNDDFKKQVCGDSITDVCGVDTQMAAEAMESLSNGINLFMDGESAFQGEKRRGQLKDKMTKSNTFKQNSNRKRVHATDLGVTTRSKRTKSNEKALKITNPDKKTALKVKEKKNGPRGRNLVDNGSAPVVTRTRKDRLATVSAASESSDVATEEAKNLATVGTDGNKRKRINGVVGAKEKALKLTTPRDGIHSDKLNHCSRDVRNRSHELSQNGKSKGFLEESARHDLGGQSTRRKRRRNRKQPKPVICSNEFDICRSPSAKNTQHERTTKEMEKSCLSACNTPVNLRTPINTSSLVCMGDEYSKLSSKKKMARPCLLKELNSLIPSRPKCTPDKGLRKKRDMASIRVLLSHHLGEDVIKNQKKIVGRLGVTAVSSINDATHFVTDEFVRTRNMLAAIAHSKPVVNHLWLESCGQAGCYIDEKNYILRDEKKEKEMGFSMPDSLASASQHPLLEGKRVLITPNTKPGVEILSSLVKAVGGQAFERICRSIYKGEKLCDELVVLSCEEDYEFCVPLLKKGAEIYSSELLLNGIVIQELEFERHRLFMDQVKKTRSTIWLKKGGNDFQLVTRRRL